jgi:hypothetical protein
LNEARADEVEVGFRYILYIDILKNYFSYNIIYLALSQSEFPMNNLPPLPCFKVIIYPFPLPHLASILLAYL